MLATKIVKFLTHNQERVLSVPFRAQTRSQIGLRSKSPSPWHIGHSS